jgi:hypothetical protein
MSRPRALAVHAGPRALAWLRDRGLRPADVRAVPAAAGGAKGLVLNPLDRWLFGHWLPQALPLRATGAPAGRVRRRLAHGLRAAARPGGEFTRMAEGYIDQRFDTAPGQLPTAAEVSRVFAANLQTAVRLGARRPSCWRIRTGTCMSSPAAAAARCCGVKGGCARHWAWPARWRHQPAAPPCPGRLDAAGGVLRPAPGAAVAADRLQQPPGRADGQKLPSGHAGQRFSIPFVLQAVHDIPGAPPGAYWDGGITDYHLHLHYAGMPEGLVLYPHFQHQVVPGWLDKPLKHRHRASPKLDNLVVLSPSARLGGRRCPAANCPTAMISRPSGTTRPSASAAGAPPWPLPSSWPTRPRTGWPRPRRTRCRCRCGAQVRLVPRAALGGRRYNRGFSIHKSEKGTLVMTPRTTLATTVA